MGTGKCTFAYNTKHLHSAHPRLSKSDSTNGCTERPVKSQTRYITEPLRAALPLFGRQIEGFDRPDAVLTGVETRSSSPVRLLRGEDGQSALRGLYPCGEGAGYAGGIMSAAVDGIRTAERLIAALDD